MPLPRRGYTLLEMLIVVAIIAALATLAWPNVRAAWEKGRLQDAARQVGIELGRTRQAAIESGQLQQFRFEPGGTRFQRGPRPAPGDAQAAALADPTAPADAVTQLALPDGVTFAGPDPTAPTTEAADRDSGDPQGQWSPAIAFYPNGRSANARLRLLGQNDRYVEVVLRGLTGTAKAGPLQQQQASP